MAFRRSGVQISYPPPISPHAYPSRIATLHPPLCEMRAEIPKHSETGSSNFFDFHATHEPPRLDEQIGAQAVFMRIEKGTAGPTERRDIL